LPKPFRTGTLIFWDGSQTTKTSALSVRTISVQIRMRSSVSIDVTSVP
jgi:hypothetical protein